MDKNYVEEGMKESFYYRKTKARNKKPHFKKKCHNLPVTTVDVIPIDLEHTNVTAEFASRKYCHYAGSLQCSSTYVPTCIVDFGAQ